MEFSSSLVFVNEPAVIIDFFPFYTSVATQVCNESTRARIINRHKQTLLYVSALLTHARERQLRLQGVLYIYIMSRYNKTTGHDMSGNKFTSVQFSVARKVTVSRLNYYFVALSVCVVCSSAL